MKIDNFICEICLEEIKQLEPHLRFGGDSVIINQDGTYGSLINNLVVVMAAFHNQCILSTLENHNIDNINYINEARVMLSAMGLQVTKKETKKTKLVCLHGGLDS